MSDKSAFRLVFALSGDGAPAGPVGLRPGTSLVVGRDASADLRLASDVVSRRHARLSHDGTAWSLEDLGSSNGTFRNGSRVRRQIALVPGDVLRFGEGGPTATFEAVGEAAVRPPGGRLLRDAPPHRSELFPLLSADRSWLTRPYAVAILASVVTFVMLLILSNAQERALGAYMDAAQAASQPFNLGHDVAVAAARAAADAYTHVTLRFDDVLGIYLGLVIFCGVVSAIGRTKPWWALACATLFTFVLMISPLWGAIYRVFEMLPGPSTDALQNGGISFGGRFVGYILHVGLREEFVKALPVLVLLFVGTRWRGSAARAFALETPVDAMLFAMASALGFVFFETLGDYVPNEFYKMAGLFPGPTGMMIGAGSSVSLCVTRIISEMSGHLGYSGYFGYMIGLGAVNPARRWTYLAIGWAGAAILHGLWDLLDATSVGYAIAAITVLLLIASVQRSRRIAGLSVPLAPT